MKSVKSIYKKKQKQDDPIDPERRVKVCNVNAVLTLSQKESLAQGHLNPLTAGLKAPELTAAPLCEPSCTIKASPRWQPSD